MSKRVEELYEDTFDEALAESEQVFVDFYADWCGPCKAVAPVVERTAKAFAGRVSFFKLNTDGNPAIASRYGIRSIPAMILFANGTEVMRTGGYRSDAALSALLESHVPGSAAEPREARTSLLARLLGRHA
jgi:thioredoxin